MAEQVGKNRRALYEPDAGSESAGRIIGTHSVRGQADRRRYTRTVTAHAHTESNARLELARRAASEAAPLIMEYFRASGGVKFDSKADGSPVTAADVGAEEIIRRLISREFPADGMVGEERGEEGGTSDFRWVIDPIDGTKSFVHGVPLFGTLIGIQRQCDRQTGAWEAVAGVASFPALDESVWAARGSGAWHAAPGRAARPARVSRVATLADATICVTSPQAMLMDERRSFYQRLNEQCGLSRGWSDCYGAMLVATGRVEVMIDPPVQLWDVAALEPIVLEAGGRYTGWDGEPTVGRTGAVASNGLVHASVLSLMRECDAIPRM